MKIQFIKVHPSWNILYPDEFIIGDIAELNKHIITTKNGRRFSADDLCKSYGNSCSYSNIFNKLKV